MHVLGVKVVTCASYFANVDTGIKENGRVYLQQQDRSEKLRSREVHSSCSVWQKHDNLCKSKLLDIILTTP